MLGIQLFAEIYFGGVWVIDISKIVPQIRTLGMTAHTAYSLVENDPFSVLQDNLSLCTSLEAGPKYRKVPIRG